MPVKLDYLRGELELKAVNVQQRIISGFAAIHNNVDRVGDIIDPAASVKAVARLNGQPLEVFISHDRMTLPIGVSMKIEARPEGLWTETKVFDGPSGDDVLGKAAGLLQHGSALGMSIGYKTLDYKIERGIMGPVRRIMDYQLNEYSLASRGIIANEKALATGVKTLDVEVLETKPFANVHACRLVPPGEFQTGSFRTMERNHDGKSYSVIMGKKPGSDAMSDQAFRYPSDKWNAAQARAHCTSHHGVEFAAATGSTEKKADRPGGKMDGDDEQKVEWNAEYIRDLPDSAFLYVEAGDVKDDEGKTIPRSKRHFPYKDAAGTIDRGHLQEALEQIPRSAGTEVDADVLVARVRRMLETSPDGVKAIVESSEWIDGAPLRIRAVAYKLLDASEKIAAEQAAMRLLGQDVKAGDRVQSTRRNELRDAERALHKVIEWTDMVEAGADSKARMDYYNRALQMMEV